MANEKTLNTRLVLKHDSLAAWQSSKYNKTPENGGEYLKNGEVAVVTVGENKDGSTAVNNNNHPVLFKVGTGAHTFDALPFASALAADVYAWAKAENVVLNNKTIEFKNGDTVVKSIAIPFITESEADKIIAEVLKSYSTTDQMNAAIKVETDRALEAEKAIGERIDAFKLPEGGFASKSEFDELKGKIEDEDGAMAKANTNAENIGKIADGTTVVGKATADATGNVIASTYETKSDASAKLTEAKGYTDTAKAAVIGASGDAKTAETVYGAKAYADDVATSKANAAQAAAEGKVTELANNIATDYALKSYADQAEADAVATAKAYTDDMKDAILGEGITETFDTLVEIQNWINGAGVNATELTEAIAAEAKLREDGDKAVQDQIDTLGITDGKVANAATADVANSLSESAKAEVKAVKVDNASYADNAGRADYADSAERAGYATSTDKAADADKLGGVAAADYALKTDVQTAEQNAKDYADSLTEIGDNRTYVSAKDDIVSIHGMGVSISGDQLEFGIDGSKIAITPNKSGVISVTGDMQVQDPTNNSSVSTKKYVDDALAAAKKYADDNDTDTTYTAKADGGLKLEGTEFSIDDSLTWIFDCGTSAN